MMAITSADGVEGIEFRSNFRIFRESQALAIQESG
jgi:hypothetical protein